MQACTTGNTKRLCLFGDHLNRRCRSTTLRGWYVPLRVCTRTLVLYQCAV